MTDKTKKILKYSGIGAIALGTVSAYLGGATESTVTATVAGVFAIIAIVISVIKG